MLNQEYTMLNQECTMLKQECTMLNQECTMLNQENTMLKQEYTTINQKCTMLQQELEDVSVLSVLLGSASHIPQLSLRGLPESHSRPKNQIATASDINFSLVNIHELSNLLGGLELEKSISMLRAQIKKSKEELMYWNEFDVQDVIQNALQDAVDVCNRIIVKILDPSSPADQKTQPPIDLRVRRESSLFSSIVDHAVVFELLSGAPVFTVETKKTFLSTSSSSPADSSSMPTGAVIGQVYDQLKEMHAKGHPNPFGALTCFNETYIICLGNYACLDVLDNLVYKNYPQTRLEQIVSNLVCLPCPASPPNHIQHDASITNNAITSFQMTQSPLQEMNNAAFWNVNQENASAKGGVVTPPKQGFKKHSDRKCLRSKCYAPESLVTAFVSAILCSLDGYQKPRAINTFEIGQAIQLEALCMNDDSYSWGMLKTTCRGPMNRTSCCCNELYLVDHLGTGATSKVYRALTEDGFDCVVKMYVQRLGDKKEQLKQKDFEEKSEAAITRELNAYRNIYGDELKEYVWTRKLNGLNCLIHPYFKHVEKSERRELKCLISKRLNLFLSKDKDKFYAFDESDQLWRHIGWFKNKLYLFDLGDLQECPPHEADDRIRSHCDRLMSRLATEGE
jgi:hypothetical protein